ncbi:MAG: metallophosphoesterase family protein [Thermodesulfobacteriota bacterium]
MHIGLISDTHIPDIEEKLPDKIRLVFLGVELILHAGDIYSPSVLDDLERIAPVLAARGDDDVGEIGLDRRVKEKHILQIDGHTLWLAHERPFALRFPDMPPSLRFPPLQNKNGEKPQEEETPDIFIFGHEHRTIREQVGRTLYINPGSPTYLNYKRGPGTAAVLDLTPDKADLRFIRL